MPSPNDCAHELLEVVPIVMRAIRIEVRSNRANDLTIPQFRSLMFIDKHPGVSLVGVSEYLGLTPPSTSKIIDGLVGKQLVERKSSDTDRRCVTLSLKEMGKSVLETSYHATQAHLAGLFSNISEDELVNINQTMQLLRKTFMKAANQT